MSHQFSDRKITVVGFEFVGLRIAVAFGKLGLVFGFDISKEKIAQLRKGFDRTGEVSKADLQVQYTAEPTDLKAVNFIIVAVLTPYLLRADF